MVRNWAFGSLLFLSLRGMAAPVVFDDGTYKALLESSACQPPITVRVEATSPDDLGYLNERFQDTIRQIATMAWLRCPQAQELQIQAMMPPATQPVMEFPVRVADQWQINPPPAITPTETPEPPKTGQPTRTSQPGPEPRPSPPSDVQEWSGRGQPAEDAALALALGKPEQSIQGLSDEEKLALMELLAAQAGSQGAWEKLVAEAQRGSRTAKLALVNLLLRTKESAPMNTSEFLHEVVKVPEEIAVQGSLAAARYLLDELTQGRDGAQLGMLPEIDAEQSHDVLQVAFAEREQTEDPDDPASADKPPPADSAIVEAQTEAATPDAGAMAAGRSDVGAPPPPTLRQGGMPSIPSDSRYDPASDPNNPSSDAASTVID